MSGPSEQIDTVSRLSVPTVTRRAPSIVSRPKTATVVEIFKSGDSYEIVSSPSQNTEQLLIDELKSILRVTSDDGLLSRAKSLINLEQEYCSQLVRTHNLEQLTKSLNNIRKELSQQALNTRMATREREYEVLERRAARVDALNREVLAKVAIRTAQHADAEKRVLKARIDQQSRTIRDLDKQLRQLRVNRSTTTITRTVGARPMAARRGRSYDGLSMRSVHFM